MDKIWTDVIKATGAVGVVAFLAYVILNLIFSEEIIGLFGSDRMFTLAIIVVSAVFIVLLVAILKTKGKNANNEKQIESNQLSSSDKAKGTTVTYRDKAKHNGDNHF